MKAVCGLEGTKYGGLRNVLPLIINPLSDAGYWADVCGCHTVWRKVDSFSNFDFLLVQKVWHSSSPCHGNFFVVHKIHISSLLLIPSSWRFCLWKPWPLRFVTWWNFKQSQRSLWDWVPWPTTCVVIGRPHCCSFDALFRRTAKDSTIVMDNWMQVFNIQCHATEKIGSIISKFIKIQQK